MININNESKLIALNINANNQSLPDADCDILAIKFGEDIEKSKKLLKNKLSEIEKPLMICGCGKDDIDRILLPELIKILDRECIISYVTEKTYKDIIPAVIKGGHYAILKTPIDMNLAKELNISAIDMGLSPDKVIMNTDIGGLGYGYEYGYSIMEKIRTEGKGDKYLDFPLYSDASSEALKTKEAKSDDFSKSWGGLNERARMIELSACAGAIAAGANIGNRQIFFLYTSGK
jgi:acetyl-CoA decarbonylase/synthase complex subunit delta